MLKRGFLLMVALLIALQSVASIVDESQLHQGDADHGEHSHLLFHAHSADPATDTSSDTSQHGADHCHHGHICFHFVIMGSLTKVCDTKIKVTFSAYQAHLITGAQTQPFRPPIS